MNPGLKELQLHVAQIAASAPVLEFKRSIIFEFPQVVWCTLGMMKNDLQFAPVFSVVKDHGGDHRKGGVDAQVASGDKTEADLH